MIVIRGMPNVNNDMTSNMQYNAAYTDVRHCEELIDYMEQNCSPKEPYFLTAIYKCNLTQEELYKEYTELYPLGQTRNDCLHV